MTVTRRTKLLARAITAGMAGNQDLYIDPKPAIVSALDAQGIVVAILPGGTIVDPLGRIPATKTIDVDGRRREVPNAGPALLLLLESLLDGKAAGAQSLLDGTRQAWLLEIEQTKQAIVSQGSQLDADKADLEA